MCNIILVGDFMNDNEFLQYISEYKEFVRNRITDLRIKANISEYQLSLELGQSKGYIQAISSGKALPSMSGFFNICNYFNITPIEFFDVSVENSQLYAEINRKIKGLSEENLELVNELLSKLT